MTNHLLMIGTSELLLIGALVLLLFGGKKLPEMMRGLGQGVRNFKEGMNETASPKDGLQETDEITGEDKENRDQTQTAADGE